MYSCLNVKCPFFVSDFMKIPFSRNGFEKYSNIKYHENHFSGSRCALCGQTDGRANRHANSRF